MKCKKCGNDTKLKNELCVSCNDAAWKQWEIDEADILKEIQRLQDEDGHSHHCACRVVWGDGECECDLYQYGYDPYAWMKGGFAGVKSVDNAFELLNMRQNYQYMWT